MHGASYVPLDLDAPEDRKAFIASEAKLAAIVSGQADIVAGMVPIVVDLALTPVHDAALLPDPGIVPGDEAYVIFTSRSEEHTSELQSLMRISYAVFCLKKKKKKITYVNEHTT